MAIRTKPLNPYSRAVLAIRVPGPPIDALSSPSPLAADTNGADNLATIKVPADNTIATMGAGTPSGVHVATDKHIDMVARSPKTSICLGEAQGVGAVDGLSISCDGDKDEHIVGKINMRCDDRVDERVADELHVTVGKDATYDYGEALTTSSKERTEHVEGDWKATVKGGGIDWTVDENVEIKAKANHSTYVQGSEFKRVLGSTEEMRVGSETKQLLGGKSEIVAGAVVEVSAGAVLEVNAAGKAEYTAGPNREIEVDKHCIMLKQTTTEILARKTAALATVAAALTKETLGVDISDPNVRFMNTTAEIKSAAAIIYK